MRQIFILALLLQGFPIFSQTTFYVNQNVLGGLQNGGSWADAFPDLQQALAIVKAGDAIWVAAGLYKPTTTLDRSSSFQLISGTSLYGGFDGSETTLQQRDFIANPTVLSGEIGDPDLRSDNSYHVVRGKGLASTTIVDGFSITQGYSYGESTILALDGLGAGMLLQGSSEEANARPMISNCIFEHNACYAGGALCTSAVDPDNTWLGEHLINPVLRNCTFDHNRAYLYGGAFYVDSPSGVGDTLEIKDCSFTGNYVYIHGGGGLFFNQTANTNIKLTSCLFERDSATLGGLGGAIYFGVSQPDQTTASLVMDSCIFIKNIASSGAGLYYAGEFSFFNSVDFYCKMLNCVFEGQKTTNGGSQAAFEISSSKGGGNVKTEIVGCKFKDNLSGDFLASIAVLGGGISDNLVDRCVFINNKDGFTPGGVCMSLRIAASTNTRINNCLFAKNDGGIAVLLQNTYGTTHINNCTFFDNNEYIFFKTKISPNPNGYHNDMYLNNCVVWEPNTDGTKMFYNNNPNVFEMYGFHVEHTITTVPSDFWQWPGALAVFGNHVMVNEYPKFVDTLAYNFRLQPCSPAVNAGNNLIVDTLGILTDLDNHPRILFDTVDLGAYETLDSCLTIDSKEPVGSTVTTVVSPNPVCPGGEMKIQVEGLEHPIVPYRLLDTYGRLRASGTAVLSLGHSLSLTAPNVPGIYLLELREGEQRVCLKVVVQ